MIPIYAQPYQQLVEDNGKLYGLDPFLIFAIGDRETLWGTSKDLDRSGPTGTGDFGKRNPARWGSILPPDGRGWGRGLMQIDFGGSKDWCQQRTPDGRYLWEIPAHNIEKGCQILHASMRSLSAVAGAHLTICGICAYNAGPGAVFRVLGTLSGQHSSPDARQLIQALDLVTAGGNYVSDVLRRRDGFADSSGPR